MNRFSCQSRIVLETLCACCHLYGNFNPLLVGTNHDPSWNLITERRNPGFISSKWNKELVNYLKVHRSNNERQCQREKLFFVQNSRKYRNIFSENSIKRRLLITEYTICNISKMLHILSFSNISILQKSKFVRTSANLDFKESKCL